MKAMFLNARVAVHFASLMAEYPVGPAVIKINEAHRSKVGQIRLDGMSPADIRIECERIRANLAILPTLEAAALTAKYSASHKARGAAIMQLLQHFERIQSWHHACIDDLLIRHYTEEADRAPEQSFRAMAKIHGESKDRIARMARDMAFELERLENSALAKLAPVLKDKQVIEA